MSPEVTPESSREQRDASDERRGVDGGGEPSLSVFARLDRARRSLGTGLAFVLFYVGCVAIVLPVFWLTLLSTRDRQVRARRVQNVIRLTFGWFTATLECARLLSTSRTGFETIARERGVLILANHPTLLDVVFLVSYVHPVDCVVKRDLWRSVWTRACVVGANYIPNDEGASLVAECVERLRAGRNVLLFPEGTRSIPGGLRPFQRGAARIALEADCDILPVFIRCTPAVLSKGSKWFQAPALRPHFSFIAQPRIVPRLEIDPTLERPAAVRQLTRALQAKYEQLQRT